MKRNLRYLYTAIFEKRLLFNNWFNPFATLFLNLKCVPFKQAMKFPIFVYGCPKFFSTYGHIHFPEMCKTGMVHFNESIPGGPQCQCGNSELNLWGNLIFRGPCSIGTANKINVGSYGTLDMDSYTKIALLCNITAYSKVHIGKWSRIAHRAQVVDTNFHFVADFPKGIISNNTKPIYIGDYCWICNNSTINGGTALPNKTIVASNSVVNKNMNDIPEESLIGGIPAKLIYTGVRRVENRKLETEMWQYFSQPSNERIYKLKGNISHAICDGI